MACHPEQPSDAQRFCTRAALTFIAFSLTLYLGGAFLSLTWDFRGWPSDLRATLAVTDFVFGGFAALGAGMSGVKGA